MTREEAIEQLKINRPYAYTELRQAVDMAIEALQTEPCEDTISRQAAIEKAIEAADEWDGGCNIEREKIITKALNELPSVTPQKVGRSEMYKILQSIRAECWDAGWNMDGEFEGAWTKYGDIEKIIDKYMKKMEEGDT